jgi:hypothetical protein
MNETWQLSSFSFWFLEFVWPLLLVICDFFGTGLRSPHTEAQKTQKRVRLVSCGGGAAEKGAMS